MITPVPTSCGSREYQPTCVAWVLSGPKGNIVVFVRPLDTCLDPRVHLRELQRVSSYKSFKTKQIFVVAIFGIFRAFLHRKKDNFLSVSRVGSLNSSHFDTIQVPQWLQDSNEFPTNKLNNCHN